ncbi:MAG: signal peptidase I [Spirochaetes bacterium]|nr:signal peptidase I [Spirochaetota bacterium]
MKSAIIKSESRLKRYPLLAFAMSLLFTGLGQMYNGDLSKGIVFFILRILSIIFIPLYIILRNNFSIIIILAVAAIHVLLWLISTIEAACSTKGKYAYNLKKYNSIFFYISFIIFNSVLMLISVFLFLSLFFVTKVENDNMNPLLLRNDYILINKYAVKMTGVGDLVFFAFNNESSAGRVIAVDADMISKKNDSYYINDSALSYSIISKSELKKMGLTDSEDLFFEINGEKRYPVYKADKNEKALSSEHIFLNKNEFLIAFDNRIKNNYHEIISKNSILGRVEGIVFSKNIKRIFNTIYLQE